MGDPALAPIITNTIQVEPAWPVRPVSLLFSDIVESTAILQRLGDQGAHALISWHDHVVRSRVRAHLGEEVELRGDGFLLAFGSISATIACAIDIQRLLAREWNQFADTPIRVRMGIHDGSAIRDEQRYFGISLIIGARICDLANGGEILLSERARLRAEECGTFEFGPARTAWLKGFQDPHRVHPLLWHGAPPFPLPPDDPADARPLRAAGGRKERTPTPGR